VKHSSIVFGTPTKNCQGHGICKVTPWAKTPLIPIQCCPNVKSFWLRSPEGFLSLKVPSKGLSSTILDKHFAGQSFLMEEPLVLPKFLQDHFCMKDPHLIPAGKYRIVRTQYFFLIQF